MATDPRKFRPSELCRLLNSTQLGEVIDERQLYRHRTRAGLRIGDARHIDLLRYVAWLVKLRHSPKPESDGDPYEKMKESARARNMALAIAGRDIGELPAVVDPERKARARTDFKYCCEAYFPLTFHLPWSDDHLKVIRKIEYAVMRGGLFALAMSRGSGKSSLLRLLYGDLAPALGGVIERGGFERGTPIELWKQTVGYISPELQSDYAIDVSILDLVASGRHASIGLNDAVDAQDLRTAKLWLGYFHLGAVAQRRPRELSYGQMRRALFARAMAAAPRLLLLDEPMTGLDTQQRHLMRELLSGLMARGITLVVAVHHAEDLPAGITHALHLHNRQARASPFVSAN